MPQDSGQLRNSGKSTDPLGALDRRLTRGEQVDGLNVDEHRRELVETAWQLGSQPHLANLKLRRWAHTLGYRGHWATRSRRYSTTLTALRECRLAWRAEPGPSRHSSTRPSREGAVPDLVSVGLWTYVGSGYRTPGDAWLADTAQRQRLEALRERRAVAGHTTVGGKS